MVRVEVTTHEDTSMEPFNGKRIATIGGGTGGFVVNRGLRQYAVSPTAICTVFDSGGNTGQLRDQYGALPQGDVRRCLLALARDNDDTLRRLFEHRFERNGFALDDYSLGNLMLLAAQHEWGVVEGIRRVASVLQVVGTVLPVSVDSAHLCAELSDGEKLIGERYIDKRSLEDDRTIVRLTLDAPAYACREAVEAIQNAHVIVLGPGDLYTSIIPNLLVKGIVEAINSSLARLCYVPNLMTKWSETRGFGVDTFVQTLQAYGIQRPFDTVLVNTTPIGDELLTHYLTKEKSEPVRLTDDVETALLASTAVREFVKTNLVSASGLAARLIRHDPQLLAHAIVGL